MGDPVSITYLAEQMIRLSGNEPGGDIEIVYTGLRPGEKLFEDLFHEKEKLEGTGHEKILLSRHRKIDWQLLNGVIARMESACETYDENTLLSSINDLVPELHHIEKALPGNVVHIASRPGNCNVDLDLASCIHRSGINPRFLTNSDHTRSGFKRV
jgi:FlaA1/EpsC-like NDP-sugar epimerase